jgi:hypothetical protein
MNPLESVGLKVKAKPSIQKAMAPKQASNIVFKTILLQCYHLVEAASTMTKPNCIKNIIALETKIQEELAPIMI